MPGLAPSHRSAMYSPRHPDLLLCMQLLLPLLLETPPNACLSCVMETQRLVWKEEEKWQKTFPARPGVRGRLWDLSCSSDQSSACPRAWCWDLSPFSCHWCPSGSCSWSQPGRGHFVFLPRSVKIAMREDPCRQSGQSGRAFPSMPAALASLPAVLGLSALSCSAGPRGMSMGDDSKLLPGPGQLIWVCRAMQFHYSNSPQLRMP